MSEGRRERVSVPARAGRREGHAGRVRLEVPSEPKARAPSRTRDLLEGASTQRERVPSDLLSTFRSLARRSRSSSEARLLCASAVARVAAKKGKIGDRRLVDAGEWIRDHRGRFVHGMLFGFRSDGGRPS